MGTGLASASWSKAGLSSGYCAHPRHPGLKLDPDSENYPTWEMRALKGQHGPPGARGKGAQALLHQREAQASEGRILAS